LFRTKIRQGATKGANFAGHYSIIEWGCGTSCVSLALVDARTGEVYGPPWALYSPQVPGTRFGSLGYGIALRFEDGSSTQDNDAVSYKLNSRLLIVRGCPNDKNCGVYYHEWIGTAFKLLRKGVAVQISPNAN
jgi:hypothetical protein